MKKNNEFNFFTGTFSSPKNSGLPFKGSIEINGFHKRKIVNENMLAGESPVRLCIRLRYGAV